jgi:hypothetical protein
VVLFYMDIVSRCSLFAPGSLIMYKEFLYFQFISFSLQFYLYGNVDFRKNCELYFVIQLWVCEVKKLNLHYSIIGYSHVEPGGY